MNSRDNATSEKLALVSFRPAPAPHITVEHTKCEKCSADRVCVEICPAQNYHWDEAAKRMSISTESCFECGSCRIACTENAITWTWPAGGFGIQYGHG